MLSQVHPFVFPFNYLDEPVHRWPDCLKQARADGRGLVLCSVLWGGHEKAPGVFDFSGTSRLGLDRFLGLCDEYCLKVDLRIGFPSHPKALPVWAQNSRNKAIVPNVFWAPHSDEFNFRKVPSLSDPLLLEGFLSFSSEVFDVVSLYAGKGGPVERIRFDFGVYDADVGLMGQCDYLSYLKTRYKSIHELNERYGLKLKNFEALNSPQGIRLLLDRRPWMAAFDYRWGRARFLLSLWDKVWALASQKALGSVLSSSLSALPEKENLFPADWMLAFDSVQVDSLGEWDFPLFPEAAVHPAPAKVYRIWEQAKAWAKLQGVPHCLIPPWDDKFQFSAGLSVLFFGHYMTAANYACVRQYTEAGGQVFFPFGTPKYDENMTPLKWKGSSQWYESPQISAPLKKIRLGHGAVWSPLRPLKIESVLWSEVAGCAQWIKTLDSAPRSKG